MSISKRSFSLYFLVLVFNFTLFSQGRIEGKLEKWNKVTLSFNYKEFSENDEDNPFLNYRLNVTFKNGDEEITIPGFFAADGNAAETSAKKGVVWQVRFMPNKTGKWTYKVSFKKGNEIAINDDEKAGESVGFDNEIGSFVIKESQSSTEGRLVYKNERYLYYSESNKPFLKGGTDSPENFLAFYEFDETPASHKYLPHSKDWNQGDPTWQNGKGKNIIGALNYLASKGMNSVYFLTMNVQGDGDDVWPWTTKNEQTRFDTSKLDQWEIVFDHMDNLGLMLHIVTQETENELLLDIGELKTQRKLYYRELIARFAHHLAITWNLGEENGPVHWSPKGQNDADRKAMAKYIKTHDPYHNFVTLHTHSMPIEQDLYLEPLLGFEFLDGPSMQTNSPDSIHNITKKWIKESQLTRKNWVVSQDEIGPAEIGAKPDADDPEHNDIRHKVLWGNLMAGGAGVEWYFGYKFAHNDLNCEDWRSRDIVWNQTKHALDFFNKYLPFNKMHSADDLTDNPDDYVFAKNDEIYAIYLPEVKETKINLFGSTKRYVVKWYNPRTRGELVNGSVKKISGGSEKSIGFPPNKDKDWVALIKSTKKEKESTQEKEQKIISLNAIQDFDLLEKDGLSYYKDFPNNVLAINASEENNRNKFATAIAKFKGVTGVYNFTFVTTAENDGESEYVIKINGTTLDTIKNARVSESFKSIRHQVNAVFLHVNDIIEITSKAVTNGLILEGNETAWSRGRWNSITFTPKDYSLLKILADTKPFEEKDGMLEIEAENYHYKSNNSTKRNWVVRSLDDKISGVNYSKSANKNSYIQALPDTRVTHDDTLILGENFFPVSGTGGVISYKIKINNPGKYYIWVNALSTGTEDNGVHVGFNENWQESGARIQWCDGKNEWTWSSAQRMPDNHCGIEKTIYLNFDKSGEYVLSFSMREDGFKMDRFILTKNSIFIPN
ncbi:DUF5060 domain-containing protein [Polaribacter undariae]|uniref:DUF5060 domain-containing protein n=1 Tax=Polaribacter sejongensis TaxID=985043 RepID=A0AAJ1QYW5_9FLAO|nr:DUF5060 domain-containing protein [Polaribacter undariae]MDN3620540.1 DUF5060 domain-containing protein [Polaribacter undariae]UWD31256.1 DUF5060 domain-containing protein [Polaribacter undariae]